MKTNSLPLAVNACPLEDEIFADLSLAFADRPVFRLGFAIDEHAVEVLLKHFADRVSRAHRWRNHESVEWQEAVLRFDERAFAYIQNWGRRSVRGYCDSLGRAEVLEKQLRDALPPRVKDPEVPWFYM